MSLHPAAAAPPPSVPSVEDPVRALADAATRELRALDALLAASDGGGPPCCAALLRAWYAVASLDRALGHGEVPSFFDFVDALERGEPSASPPGASVVASGSVAKVVGAARVPASPRDDWPARRELLLGRRGLRAWYARLERALPARRRWLAGVPRAWLVVFAVAGAFTLLRALYRPPVWRVVYFKTTNLTTPVASDLTANVGDDWGTESPHREVPADGFSDRWESCLVLRSPHVFEFVLGSDDGSRLYVDDQLVVNQWRDQGYTEKTEPWGLTAGKHAIRVEHYDSGGGAELSLRARIDGKGSPRSLPRSLLQAPGQGPRPCE